MKQGPKTGKNRRWRWRLYFLFGNPGAGKSATLNSLHRFISEPILFERQHNYTRTINYPTKSIEEMIKDLKIRLETPGLEEADEYVYEKKASKYQEHQNHLDNFLSEIKMKLKYSINKKNFWKIRKFNNQFKELQIIILT